MESEDPQDADAVAFRAAGLYDPAAPGAEARLDLLRFLAGRGATVERMVVAEAADSLVALPIDLLLESGELSATELADRMEVPVEDLVVAYRMVGVEVPDVHARVFDESELRFLRLLTAAVATFDDDSAREILRAVSLSLSSLSAAAVSAFVGSVEDDLAAAGDPLAWSRTTAAVGELGMDLAEGLAPLFRHHLRQNVLRYRTLTRQSPDRQSAQLAVGFVDLVGYTSSTEDMEPLELIEFVGRFRERTHEVVDALGGQVVKHIGDEIMFSAVDAATGCRIALALVEAFRHAGAAPRGGVAHGRVVPRHGDLYGAVVNLASRLTDIAVPGELLAPAAMAGDPSVGGAALRFEPAGRRALKGFTEPVAVVSVSVEPPTGA